VPSQTLLPDISFLRSLGSPIDPGILSSFFLSRCSYSIACLRHLYSLLLVLFPPLSLSPPFIESQTCFSVLSLKVSYATLTALSLACSARTLYV
jgi:hypothetical protein